MKTEEARRDIEMKNIFKGSPPRSILRVRGVSRTVGGFQGNSFTAVQCSGNGGPFGCKLSLPENQSNPNLFRKFHRRPCRDRRIAVLISTIATILNYAPHNHLKQPQFIKYNML